jgi:hypothetical protein
MVAGGIMFLLDVEILKKNLKISKKNGYIHYPRSDRLKLKIGKLRQDFEDRKISYEEYEKQNYKICKVIGDFSNTTAFQIWNVIGYRLKEIYPEAYKYFERLNYRITAKDRNVGYLLPKEARAFIDKLEKIDEKKLLKKGDEEWEAFTHHFKKYGCWRATKNKGAIEELKGLLKKAIKTKKALCLEIYY